MVAQVRLLALAVMLAVVLSGCASNDGTSELTEPPVGDDSGQQFPDVIDATVESDDSTLTFRVTISSPYDSPERYADGWRIMGEDGTVYGAHTLLHDHANEQPFTRTQTGVRIPEDARQVIVEGRDSEHGYGGATTTVTLP